MWSKVITPSITDLVSGHLTKLDESMAMDIIAGILVGTHKGRFQYYVINDAGVFSILECELYFLPDIKVRLFIPQGFIQEI